MVLCDWLLPLSILFSWHLCCSMYQYFILVYSLMMFHCMDLPHFISSIGGHLVVSIFWLLIFLPWRSMYEFLCKLMFLFLLGMGLLGHMVALCLTCFPKKLHHFTLPCEGSHFPTTSPILLTVCLFDSQSRGLKCYLLVVLVCISLMRNDVEHCFVYLLAIYILFLEKCLVMSFAWF